MNEKNEKKETKTGRYIYDKKTGKVIKISDEIVSIKKSSNGDTGSCESGNCNLSGGCSCCG